MVSHATLPVCCILLTHERIVACVAMSKQSVEYGSAPDLR